MKLVSALLIAGVFAIGLVGCGGEKSSMTKETTVKTPEGETKVTQETTVEKTGENPPPAKP